MSDKKQTKEPNINYHETNTMSMSLSDDGPTFTTLTVPLTTRDRLRSYKIIDDEPYYKVLNRLMDIAESQKKKKNLF
jgi:hypothetical protein